MHTFFAIKNNQKEDFYKPKIVYQELTQGSTFAIDEDGTYMVSNTAYLITGEHLDYLLKILNSYILEYIYRTFYATMLGTNGIRWLAQHIVKLPIPRYADGVIHQSIINETNPDNYIAQLYGITVSELDFIRSL